MTWMPGSKATLIWSLDDSVPSLYSWIIAECDVNNQEVQNHVSQMYPGEFENTKESITSIYNCRSGGTVNFTLQFMTNETISISTSQTFRFSIFAGLSHFINRHIRYARACASYKMNPYGKTGELAMGCPREFCLANKAAHCLHKWKQWAAHFF